MMRLELGQIKWLLVKWSLEYPPTVGEVRRVRVFRQPRSTVCLGSWEIKRVYPESSLVLLVPGRGSKRRFMLKTEKIKAIGLNSKVSGKQKIILSRTFGKVAAGEFIAEPNSSGTVLRRAEFEPSSLFLKTQIGDGSDDN